MEIKRFIKKDEWQIVFNMNDKEIVAITAEDLKEFIPKKVAAIEVFKEAKMRASLCFITILSCCVVAISSFYTILAGAIAAGIFSIGAAYFLIKAQSRKKQLETDYKLNPIEI